MDSIAVMCQMDDRGQSQVFVNSSLPPVFHPCFHIAADVARSKELSGSWGSNGVSDAGEGLVDRGLARGVKGDWSKLANNPEPNMSYTFENGYSYQTDAQARVVSVEADLKLDPWDRNSYQQGKAAKCGIEGDCGGHILAAMFGGSGERLNIVPMDSRLNGAGGDWYKLE